MEGKKKKIDIKRKKVKKPKIFLYLSFFLLPISGYISNIRFLKNHLYETPYYLHICQHALLIE